MISLNVLTKRIAATLKRRGKLLKERTAINEALVPLELSLVRDRKDLARLTQHLLADPPDLKVTSPKKGRPVTRSDEYKRLLEYLRANAGMRVDFRHAARTIFGSPERPAQKRVYHALAFFLRRGAVRRTGRAQYAVVEQP